MENLEGRSKLAFLPPYSSQSNREQPVRNDIKNNAVGRAKLEGPKNLHHASIPCLRFAQYPPTR